MNDQQNFLRHATSCLLLAIPLIMTTMANAQSVSSKYAVVIHGGAGRAPQSESGKTKRAVVLKQALTTAQQKLESGAASLDVVETVVRILEDAPEFNAGKGSVFNAAKKHELDATIMDGRDRSAGAVGGVTIVRNPVSLARRVMTDTKHVLLVSRGADQFARQYKDDEMIEIVENSFFSTDDQLERLQRVKQQLRQSEQDSIGTVGCVALDKDGNLAAATSTGGLTNKKFGRLGDSPIVGAGTYADNETCAVSCTGIGEDFMRSAIAYDVSARMRYLDQTLEAAVDEAMLGTRHPVRGGVIAVDSNGNLTMKFNTPAMARAVADSKGRFEIHVAE